VTAEFSPEDRNVLSAQCSVLSKMVTSFLCKDLKKNLGTDLFLSVSNSCHGVGGPLLLGSGYYAVLKSTAYLRYF
jgi:hypothetical protein